MTEPIGEAEMRRLAPVRLSSRNGSTHTATRRVGGRLGLRDDALEIEVSGIVQGVGFRPFVARLARRHGLTGWVRNESGAVRIFAEGRRGHLQAFRRALRAGAPPLACIEHVLVRSATPTGAAEFRVVATDTSPAGRLPVSPDVAICRACERELMDPEDRRYRYPFITCTDCGPRFTLTESMPYDRERTTMRRFEQCPECLREYHDPSDRRFRSETNSCPSCGPTVWFTAAGETDERGGRESDTVGAIERAIELVLGGGVLAARGLGGFHLVVDATNEAAVDRLRALKGREAKPFAVMMLTLPDVMERAEVERHEIASLCSPRRPIVLVTLRSDHDLASGIAPGLRAVGIMLPYTPLHRLLLEAAGRPLVMTSGNVTDEPIAKGNEEAISRLSGLADGFLLHDREIVTRCDDSVARVVGSREVLMRRARGYAPAPLHLPVPTSVPLLAVGPHLKNTFTLADGCDAFVSPHIGDLENLEALEHFHECRRDMEVLFHIDPVQVVRDLHPGYLSTRVARDSGLDEVEPVQHHHAHVAAVLAEHGRQEPVLGIALDGTGFGPDGTIWGGELMVADLKGFERVGHLRPAPLPGGDRAVRAPWRALAGYLTLPALDSASRPSRDPWRAAPFSQIGAQELGLVRQQAAGGLNAPLASSMGRLFDAAASAIGLRSSCTYEGQAAMELEAAAGALDAEPWQLPVRGARTGVQIIDPLPMLVALLDLRRAGVPVEELASRFHESVAESVSAVAARICDQRGITAVALAGGCFQNARLLTGVDNRLRAGGLEVLVPKRLSPNDGAISYGQAAVAAARLAT